ncbi:MAG: hypothetical protein AB7O59_21905 [Pirellulales bacterium]
MVANPLRRLPRAVMLPVLGCLLFAVHARAAQIVFDLPPSIECRDATPDDFRAAHPTLKVIEGRLRISARVADGAETDVVDFLYVIDNPARSMRFQDYLPNTLLESAVAEDQIEITDASEKVKGGGVDARVIYQPFTLGGTVSHSGKSSESSHYKKIAPKELVLASGTTNREHGVFYRLRPSRTASLEGAKEFTFLAVVPGTWRGDLCAISCTARGEKVSLFSSSVAAAGAVESLVPVFLVGDEEAAELAREFRHAQEALASAQAARQRDSVFDMLSSHAVGLFTSKTCETKSARELAAAEKALADSESRLGELAR